MESLGVKLKTAREARGLSFEQVSRETNIAIRYLEALETEYFESFPGEPYTIGFLKTYGSYLDLDTQELISLYRAHRIQEQPVPVEQLLRKPSPLPKIALVVAIGLAVCGAVAGSAYFISRLPERPVVQAPAVRSAVEYAMAGDSLERRLYPGDTILVSLNELQYKLELGSLGDTITIRTPTGFESLNLGQSVTVDLDRNGVDDVQVTLADFAKNNVDMGALVRFELNFSSPHIAGETSEIQADIPANLTSSTVIFSSPNAYPFTVQSNFQGFCLFRWEVLRERDRRDRNEQYFGRADELNIPAQNGVRIWASNAQSAKIQVIGGGRTVPVELGSAGEVVVAEIRWVRDEENRFRLILVRLET